MWGQMASTDGGKKMRQNVEDIREARTHPKTTYLREAPFPLTGKSDSSLDPVCVVLSFMPLYWAQKGNVCAF